MQHIILLKYYTTSGTTNKLCLHACFMTSPDKYQFDHLGQGLFPGTSSKNTYHDPSIGLGLAPVSNKLDRRVVLKEGRTRY